jgi:Transcriptional regulatory protein, C terminal
MGAVPKNPVSQLMPAAAQPVSSLFANDSATPIRTMGLKEAWQLSQFVPVIVLLLAFPTNNGGDPTQTAANDSLVETPPFNGRLALICFPPTTETRRCEVVNFSLAPASMPPFGSYDATPLWDQSPLDAATLQPGTSDLVELFGKAVTQCKVNSTESDLVLGDVGVNFSSMEASRKGEPVKLTALEFKTLKYLAQNTRRVISRDELLNEVWGYKNYPRTRTVDNQILRLRQELEKDPSRPIHFRTVHGAGYKFLP